MNTLKTILLHIDASAQCHQRIEAAGKLADAHQARVNALYAVVPGVLQFPFADGVGAELLQRIRPLDDERRAQARILFDRVGSASLRDANWLDPVEDISLRGFTRQAFYSDLLVLGQRAPDDHGKAGVPSDFVETVLIDTGKPALIIPYIGAPSTLGETIMLAWKESRETANAVAAALPVLQRAKRVHIATWGREESAEIQRTAALLEQLRLHGVEATLHHRGPEPGDIGEYMLSAAADFNADMLVMGAYSRSRAREWVLGGATRTIMESMTIPVLMAR